MTDHAKALADALMETLALLRKNAFDQDHRTTDKAQDIVLKALRAYDAHPAEAATRENGDIDPHDSIVRNIIFEVCHEHESDRQARYPRYRRQDVIEAGRRIRDHFAALSAHQQQGAESENELREILAQEYEKEPTHFAQIPRGLRKNDPEIYWAWRVHVQVALSAMRRLSRAPQLDTVTEAIRHTASQGTYDEMAIRKAVSFGLAELIVAERAALAARGKA